MSNYSEAIKANVEFAVKEGFTPDQIIYPLVDQMARTIVAAARNVGANLEDIVETYRARLDDEVVKYAQVETKP